MPQTTAHRSAGTTGFTLVELLIVITAMAILAAVTLPQISSSTLESKEANALGNLAAVRQSIERYRIEHHDAWPSAEIQTQLTNGTKLDGSPGTRFGPYLRTQFPLNPMAEARSIHFVESMPAEPDGTEAWIYCTTTGDIRLNTTGEGPSGIDWFAM